jgi:hypothetical protein
MRAWGLPHSRQLDSQLRDLAARMRPRCDHSSHPLQERACGTPDAQRIRSLVRKSEKHTSVVTTNTPKTSGVPHAMGYGLLRALPGDRSICFVTVVATEDVSLPGWAGLSGATFANVRASGPHDLGRPRQHRRQRFIGNSQRPLKTRRSPPASSAPDAAASTASRPASVTIASRPSWDGICRT